MTPRLSGHFSVFGMVFFMLKSLLGIARQWSLEKFAISTLKPRRHVRILFIERGLFLFVICFSTFQSGDLLFRQFPYVIRVDTTGKHLARSED